MVNSLKDCIKRHQEDPTKVLFRLSNPEGKKVYSLEDSSSWPKLAVDKRLESLLPNTIYEDEELLWEDPKVSLTENGRKKLKSEYFQWLDMSDKDDTPQARGFYKQMLNEAASKSQTLVSSKKGKTLKAVEDLPPDRQPNVTVTQNHRESPSEAPDPHSGALERLRQDLVKVLPNSSDVIEQYRSDIEIDAAIIRTLAALVLNSNTNYSMSDKPNRSFPEMLGTDKSLEAVNPVTGTKDYTAKTTLAERVRDLDQVPARQTVVVGNPCGKICVGCEAKVFEKYIKGLPTPGKGMFNFGPWTKELRDQLTCVQTINDWFCPVCPSTAEGSPILLPAPGAIWICPGVKCGATHMNPCDGVMNKCPHCNLSYMYG